MESSLSAFISGILAGYGIAVPVGAIAVLILDTALLRGFRSGFMAGAGAATGDLIYASLAALAGGPIAAALSPLAWWLKLASAAVLLAIGGKGLWRMGSIPSAVESHSNHPTDGLQIYARFLALTMINPLTVAYFSALILAQTISGVDTLTGGLLFVLGAGIASLSWQTLLAGLGTFGHRHLSRNLQIATRLVGNLVVVGFGLRIIAELL